MFRRVLRSITVTALAGTLAFPVAAQSVSGAYLAGRQAALQNDYGEASRYYSQALIRDRGNVELIESATLSFLSLGDFGKAYPLAQSLEERNAGSQVARIVITAGLAEQEDYAAILARDPDTSGIGPWVDGLSKAWARMGLGEVSEALEAFDALSEEPGMRGFVMYHKALALASVGDFEGADAIFSDEASGTASQTRRGVIAHAEVLAQLDRRADAVELIRAAFGDGTDPELDMLINALENDGEVPYTHVRTARDGIAEVYFTFGAVLKSEDAGDAYVLLYTRVARYLRPDHIDALLLTASILEGLGQYDLAIEEYGDVPREDPAYHAAELGRADALRRSGAEDQAIVVLEQLAETHGDLAVVHSTLGDVLRRQDKYADAIGAYDRALSLASDTRRGRWVLYYSRGIAHERSGDDEASEADFRAALAINPDQPQVLNYLGYSMVEQKRNLDEALDMIERAVAASPNSGYIVDSLGWVLYRLGRYPEAVEQMERAVALLPVDPVVNDHLGDVYWAVGRVREAEFQWHRALSFIDPEDTESEADPERIRRKLDIGLDLVLEEEGAPPLGSGNDI